MWLFFSRIVILLYCLSKYTLYLVYIVCLSWLPVVHLQNGARFHSCMSWMLLNWFVLLLPFLHTLRSNMFMLYNLSTVCACGVMSVMSCVLYICEPWTDKSASLDLLLGSVLCCSNMLLQLCHLNCNLTLLFNEQNIFSYLSVYLFCPMNS